MVYDDFDLSQIARDELRGMISGQVPNVIDVPELLTVIYPELQMICVVEGRRIRLNDTSGEDVGVRPLPKMAVVAHKAVLKGNLVAYGFNYEITGSIMDTDNSRDFILQKFLPSDRAWEKGLRGELTMLVPQLTYLRDDVRYQLRLQPHPSEGSGLKAHFNVHFAGVPLPEVEDLDSSLKRQFEDFVRTLEEL